MKLRVIAILSLFVAVSCSTMEGITGGSSSDLNQKKQALRALADTARTSGNSTAAAELEGQIVSLDSSDEDSFVNLGKTLRKMGKTQESLDILQTGLELNPESEKILLGLARSYVASGDPDAALGRLSLVTKFKEREFYNIQGVAFDMIGEHQQAQNSYKTWLAKDMDDDFILNNLAVSYILDQKYKDAITILSKLANGPKSRPKYRQNLALAYGMQANPDQAMRYLMKDMPKEAAKQNLDFYKLVSGK